MKNGEILKFESWAVAHINWDYTIKKALDIGWSVRITRSDQDGSVEVMYSHGGHHIE